MGRLYGLSGTWIGKDSEAVIASPNSGHPVIAHMCKGISTHNGHYIVLPRSAPSTCCCASARRNKS